VDVNEVKEILNKATDAMVKSLNSFGPGETLKLLVTYSNQDWILTELLTRFPYIVTTSLFLFRKPIVKAQMDAETIKRFSKSYFPVFKREESGEEEEATSPRRAPRTSKKIRCRKEKIR
jgi:hypothetical protein